MALVAQEIPKVGLVMEAVRVTRWLKNVGDTVMAGEPLVEVETEKSVVEIEAAATGRLSQILVQVDSRRLSAIRSPGSNPPRCRMRLLRRRAGPMQRASEVLPSPASWPPNTASISAALPGPGPGGRVQLDDVQRAIDVPRRRKRRAVPRRGAASFADAPRAGARHDA